MREDMDANHQQKQEPPAAKTKYRDTNYHQGSGIHQPPCEKTGIQITIRVAVSIIHPERRHGCQPSTIAVAASSQEKRRGCQLQQKWTSATQSP
jgi:hypothetical protein